MNLLADNQLVVASLPPRLDSTKRDGGAWFSARWRCGKNYAYVKGFKAALRKQRRFAGLGVELYQLVGELLCEQPALLDKAIVELACMLVRQHHWGPWAATHHALLRLLASVGNLSSYQKLLRAAVIHRYWYHGSQHPLLEYAVYQQLQMPFALFSNLHPAPLHMFPVLSCGSLVGCDYPSVSANIYRFRAKWELFEAEVIVWLHVLLRFPWTMAAIYDCLGAMHRVILHGYSRYNARTEFVHAVRRITNELMELYLLCNLPARE
jgi:hypothetical protein